MGSFIKYLKSGYSLNYYFILQTDSSGGKNHTFSLSLFLSFFLSFFLSLFLSYFKLFSILFFQDLIEYGEESGETLDGSFSVDYKSSNAKKLNDVFDRKNEIDIDEDGDEDKTSSEPK